MTKNNKASDSTSILIGFILAMWLIFEGCPAAMPEQYNFNKNPIENNE